MEEDSSHEEMSVLISSDSGTVDINSIQDSALHGESLELNEERDVETVQSGNISLVPCGKPDKPSTVQAAQDTAIATYPAPDLAQPTLLQSVMCPGEPMDQSSVTLPTLAVSSNSDSSERAAHGERSDIINQAWFTTKEDKDSLQGKGAKWRQGMWSKEEIGLLRANISEYCKVRGIPDPCDVIFKQSKDERKTFYRTIAKGIHRPLFAIYRRVLRMYESGNYVGKYSSDEVQRLKELKKKHGNDWTAIGLALGRSASSVKDRCRLLKEKCSSGKWTEQEEERLSKTVRELTCTKPGESITTGILWTHVAKTVGTRSEKQCRSKWLNYLNWKECGGKEWNKTDEIDLIKKIYELGVENENEIDWVSLTNGWVCVRSPQWLRSKWWTIKKNVPSVQGLSFPDTISYLNSHYARNLGHRVDHRDPRYLQIATSEHFPLTNMLSTTTTLSPLTTALTTTVGHAITVDGEIFMTREDDKGSDGLNGFEMVQLRALPNTDPSQPTSYIIEPVHCDIPGSASSYILHQTSPSQGTKVVKLATSAMPIRQLVNTQVVGNSQHGNVTGNNLLTSSPLIVSSLAQVSGHGDLATIVATETLHVEQSGENCTSDEGSESYTDKKTTQMLEEDEALECLAEQEILTTTDAGTDNPEEFDNTCDKESEHSDASHDASLSQHSPSSTVSQSLEINFPTSDNVIYSPRSEIITNEVVIPQSTLPDHILQSQGDEPAFFI